jgi:peroxin-7
VIEKDHIASASWDRSVKIWNVHRSTSLSHLQAHSAEVYGVAWHPYSASWLASGSADGTAILYDLHTAIPSLSFRHIHQVLSLDWNKYQKELLATGCIDGTISIWDLRQNKTPLYQFKGHVNAIKRLQWSPHVRSYFITASYDTFIRLWDLDSSIISTSPPTPIEVIQHHSEFVYGVDFNLHHMGDIASCSFDGSVVLFHSSCLKRRLLEGIRN